jgi:hypothetical protein
MKKSIGRTFAHIDVAANSSVRIHDDFFNTHAIYQLPKPRNPDCRIVEITQSETWNRIHASLICRLYWRC